MMFLKILGLEGATTKPKDSIDSIAFLVKGGEGNSQSVVCTKVQSFGIAVNLKPASVFCSNFDALLWVSNTCLSVVLCMI